MKLYQTIAPMMLCIMYTTTIFGLEEATLSEVTKKVPKVIWEIIDEFRGTNGVYKEICHLKSYQHLCEKLRKLVICTGITTLAAAVLVQKLLKISPKRPVLFTLGLASLASIVSEGYHKKNQINFHLLSKSPDRVEICDDQKIIALKSTVDGNNGYQIEFRSLSNMRLVTVLPQIPQSTFLSLPNLAFRDNLVYVLRNGKIGTVLFDDHDDYNKSEDRLCSLQTPDNVTKFAVSKDQDTMVTIDEGGFLRKWELQRSKDMDTIMNTD